MPRNPRMSLWLDLLHTLYPPHGVLLVGAGDGSSAWVRHLVQWDTRHVTLVEGDEVQFQHLHDQVADRGGWHLRQQVVAADATRVTYHHASLAPESGLIAPESLRPLWPHLATRHTRTHQATTLDTLMRDHAGEQAPNWLLVDCLPALSLLQGAAAHLPGVEVIAARVLLGHDPLAAGPAGREPLQAWLQAQGFMPLETESGRHPAIGHALFVRDTRAALQALRTRQAEAARATRADRAELERLNGMVRQTQATASQLCARQSAQIEHLTQALKAAEALARDRQHRLDQLQQTTTQAAAQAAAQADAAATAQAVAHADERARLAQALETAETLARDRQQQLDQLQQAATQAAAQAAADADAAHRAHADAIAHLATARDTAEQLAAYRQRTIGQLRQSAEQAAAQAADAAAQTAAQADAAAQAQARTHADERARLAQALDAAEALARDRQQALATQLDQQTQARAAADQLVTALRAQARQDAGRSRGDADIDDLVRDLAPFFTERSITYVDVGAYVGEVFLKLTGSKHLRVREAHLYEPNPTSYQTLTARLESSRLPTLHAYHLAVGARAETLHFNAAQSMTRVVAPEPGAPQVSNTFTAHSVTLDEQARLFTDRRIHLLKIDVEGRELDVLTGATALLQEQRIDMLYIEVGFNPQGTQQTYFGEVDRFLQDKGYRVFRIYEQMNEWTEDSPLLRRCNFAYMSERFARANPSKLTRRLQTLQDELHRLKSAQTQPLTPATT